jgi:hypothetical protein
MGDQIPPLSNQLCTTPARLDFLSPLPKYNLEKPYYISHYLPGDRENYRTNLEYVSEVVHASDIRGAEEKPDLDRSKFEFLRHKSAVQFTPDAQEEEVEKVHAYLKETVTWVKERLQADLCLAYSYVVSDMICSTGLLIVSRKMLICDEYASFAKHQVRQIPQGYQQEANFVRMSRRAILMLVNLSLSSHCWPNPQLDTQIKQMKGAADV